jgi:hypothetical protein
LDEEAFNKSLGRTLRTFYLDINQGIIETNIPLSKIKALQNNSAKDIQTRKRLFELCLPLYILLRNKAYTDEDLIA